MTEQVEAAAGVLGALAERGRPLGPLTTYRVGGRAALFVEAMSLADLALVGAAVAASGLPVLVVGRGSNLLVADAGFPGLALMLGEPFATISVDGSVVQAGGAVALPVLARRTAAAGLSGLEWAVGVPGSVGGAVRMNAGGHGAETRDRLVRAALVALDATPAVSRDVPVGALDLGYRHSAVRSCDVVVGATFALDEGDSAESEVRIGEIVRWRRAHQPGGQNAGSVFTNPPGDSAGRIIDAAGLKGLRVGSAVVSDRHANFIQADEGGSADDVVALIREVRRRVEDSVGVHLQPEVHMVGFA